MTRTDLAMKTIASKPLGAYTADMILHRPSQQTPDRLAVEQGGGSNFDGVKWQN